MRKFLTLIIILVLMAGCSDDSQQFSDKTLTETTVESSGEISRESLDENPTPIQIGIFTNRDDSIPHTEVNVGGDFLEWTLKEMQQDGVGKWAKFEGNVKVRGRIEYNYFDIFGVQCFFYPYDEQLLPKWSDGAKLRIMILPSNIDFTSSNMEKRNEILKLFFGFTEYPSDIECELLINRYLIDNTPTEITDIAFVESFNILKQPLSFSFLSSSEKEVTFNLPVNSNFQVNDAQSDKQHFALTYTTEKKGEIAKIFLERELSPLDHTEDIKSRLEGQYGKENVGISSRIKGESSIPFIGVRTADVLIKCEIVPIKGQYLPVWFFYDRQKDPDFEYIDISDDFNWIIDTLNVK